MNASEKANRLTRENNEIEKLLGTLFRVYGYDFRNYARAHIKRRIRNFLKEAGLPDVAVLNEQVAMDRELFAGLLVQLTVHTTELFRDPDFYTAFRKQVVPWLRTFPSFKIWHAGCSTGEEVYSMAILLREEDLYERSLLYATDVSPLAVQRARDGIFRMRDMKEYTRNYQQAGGKQSLSDYYTAKYDGVVMDKTLREKAVFSTHNLALDTSFGEMHVVICRNVLIYFDKTLQSRVFELFRDSLIRRGMLCLGSKETVRYSSCSGAFEDLEPRQKIYRLGAGCG